MHKLIYLKHISRQARLDRICASLTGFPTFDHLLNARGSYRPTIHTLEDLDLGYLADCYDQAMASRNDDRRTYRGFYANISL